MVVNETQNGTVVNETQNGTINIDEALQILVINLDQFFIIVCGMIVVCEYTLFLLLGVVVVVV